LPNSRPHKRGSADPPDAFIRSLGDLVKAWPGGASALECPLPRVVQDALARAGGRPVTTNHLDDLLAAAGPLLAARGSEQALVGTLLSTRPEHLPLAHAAAALLALRPLARPDRVLARLREVVDSCGGARGKEALPRGEWERVADYLLALIATDTTAGLPLHQAVFGICLRADDHPGPDPALFLSLLKLLQHRLVDYAGFGMAVLEGRALDPGTYCGRRVGFPFYHPVLDYLGISEPPYFRMMYHRLVHEMAVTDPPAEWPRVCWIRRYPGLAYLRRALERLASEPTLGALHMARWCADLEEDGEYLHGILRGQPAPLLYLLSLVRHDLDARIGRALGDPEYARGMRWLHSPPREAWRQVVKDAPLRAWLAARGEFLAGTVRALLSFKEPERGRTRLAEVFAEAVAERSPTAREEARERAVRACLQEHIMSDLPTVLANLDLLHAARGKGVRRVETRAREGRPSAIRALALYEPPYRDRFVPLLLELRRGGNPAAAQAAREALELVAARYGARSVRALEERLELKLAWEDAGLQGAPSRVWWPIGDCRLKLAVTAGRATITAYGPKGPRRSIPAQVRRHPDFAQVKAARRQLQETYGRFRDRLEEAMVAERALDREHLGMLRENAVFRDLLARLVLADETGELFLGEHWPEPARVWVAHPVRMLDRLRQWQDHLAEHSIIQPFKQCFREVYPLEPGEAGAQECTRFAGYPLVARKAFALLRARHYHPRAGEARLEWPERQVTACLVWAAEGEKEIHRHLVGDRRDEPVTSGAIRFLDGTGNLLPLDRVDPIVFSETLRDADLLVAAAGAAELGFSSRQTAQFRAAMLRQLARALRQWNIYTSESGMHALVQGALATYRVHLGSGTVFLEPEGRSIMVPLPESDSGLPLEAVDPGTARILLTVLTLARDTEITTPAFRAQLTPGQVQPAPGEALPQPPGKDGW